MSRALTAIEKWQRREHSFALRIRFGKKRGCLHHFPATVGAQRRIARELGVSPQFVSQVVNGKKESSRVERALRSEWGRLCDLGSVTAPAIEIVTIPGGLR